MPRMISQPELVRTPPGASSDDDRLIRARAGDMDAWAGLYREHFDAVFRHVCYLTGDAAAAEDLTQDTFARALTRLDSFGGRATFSTWLHGIAVNVTRVHWRSARATVTATRRVAEVALVRAGDDNPVDSADLRRRRTQALYAVLHELPENLREAFVVVHLEGLSPAEAGVRLDISPGNVSVRAHRARGKIQERLQAMGWLDHQGATS